MSEQVTPKKMTYGDIFDALEAGNWQILDIHYEAKLNRMQREAIQEVHEDVVDFCNHHLDGKDYKTVIECLRKWEESKGNR